jgi:hypothetical protein
MERGLILLGDKQGNMKYRWGEFQSFKLIIKRILHVYL